MRFVPGDVVSLLDTRVSHAGGNVRTFSQGLTGRVCKVHASGFCCVQFPSRCLRVSETFLTEASGAAPNCKEPCRAGC